MITHDVKRGLQAAKRMMERRNKTMTQTEEETFKVIFESSEKQKRQHIG